MGNNYFKSAMAIMLSVVCLFLVACGGGGNTTLDPDTEEGKPTEEVGDVGDVKPSADVEMTDVGTPRSETLIVDMLNGNVADPDLCNPYMPGAVAMDAGFHQLVFSHLWEIDTVKGEQFPDLAANMPEALDDTMTKFQFKIREGIKWSDGVDFTAEDVEFTANMILNTPEISYSGYFSTVIKSMKAIDKYTVEIETFKPEAKIAQRLGVVIWGHSFRPVPKHIFENEDAKSFKYTNPLSLGPYALTERDPQGNWFLYEKREDWQNSDVGIIVGEPGPQYILFKYFGPEEKRIMAAINNEIDILQDITPESWDILKAKNTDSKAWYDNFPYADMDDPCQRGITMNCAKAPYDNVDVRWALALATDIKTVSMSTFGGMLRVSPIQVPPTATLQEAYHKPMTPWLKEFALEDGYKPFDDSYAKAMVDMLNQQGVEGLPTSEQEMIDVFGVGWWKYDIEKAAELLEKSGFTKKDDKWMLPDGTPWQVVINAPANFEIQSMRLAFAVADTWKKFGIDAQVKQMDSATFWNAEATGEFDVGSYWPSCGILADTSENMAGWNKKYIVPIGERAPGNAARWSNDRVSELLEELSGIPSDDPRIVEKITEINKEFVAGIPFLAMVGTSKFVPVIESYWTGFQTSENAFEGPWWWWSQFKFYTPHFKPTGK